MFNKIDTDLLWCAVGVHENSEWLDIKSQYKVQVRCCIHCGNAQYRKLK